MKMALRFTVSMTLALITAAACFAQNCAQTNPVSNPAVAACVTEPQLDSPRSTTAIHARIRSTPSGADIFVDGTYVGTTPLDIGLTCCFHDVSITKSGLKPWTGRIRNNGHPNINVHLQK